MLKAAYEGIRVPITAIAGPGSRVREVADKKSSGLHPGSDSLIDDVVRKKCVVKLLRLRRSNHDLLKTTENRVGQLIGGNGAEVALLRQQLGKVSTSRILTCPRSPRHYVLDQQDRFRSGTRRTGKCDKSILSTERGTLFKRC